MAPNKDPLEKVKQALDRVQEQNSTLKQQLEAGSALEAEYEKLVDKQSKTAVRYDKLLMRVGYKHSKASAPDVPHIEDLARTGQPPSWR